MEIFFNNQDLQKNWTKRRYPYPSLSLSIYLGSFILRNGLMQCGDYQVQNVQDTLAY